MSAGDVNDMRRRFASAELARAARVAERLDRAARRIFYGVLVVVIGGMFLHFLARLA